MSGSLLREETEVYSEKYDIHGVVKDYGVVTKLFFSYGGKDIEMGIVCHPFLGEKYEDVGRNLIESYISSLATDTDQRKLQLHYWYIDEYDVNGEMYRIAHGIVTGHKKLTDSIDIDSSAVHAIGTR